MDLTAHDLLDAAAAAALLNVKRSTLYAYVSRGLIRALPGPGRAKRYPRADLERLRSEGAPAATPREGAPAPWTPPPAPPVLASGLTTLGPEGPLYRGRAAVALAHAGYGFEATAELLWRGAAAPEVDAELWRGAGPPLDLALEMLWLPDEASPFDAIRLTLGLLDGKRPAAGPRAEAIERADARGIIRLLASAAGVARDPAAARAALDAPSVAAALAVACGVPATPATVAALDRALVLVADHGINLASFAARAVASAGGELSASLLAAAAVQSGPRYGGVTAAVEGLLDEALGLARPLDVLARRHTRGEPIPGFGHAHYPEGDPRGAALLSIARALPAPRPAGAAVALDLAAAMARAGQPAPNADFGLVALARALNLPRGAAPALFIVGRAAGWVAHVFEQRASGAATGLLLGLGPG